MFDEICRMIFPACEVVFTYHIIAALQRYSVFFCFLFMPRDKGLSGDVSLKWVAKSASWYNDDTLI